MDRVVESMPHVERTGHVGRRNNDAKRVSVRVVFGAKDPGFFPGVVPGGFDPAGFVRGLHDVFRSPPSPTVPPPTRASGSGRKPTVQGECPTKPTHLVLQGVHRQPRDRIVGHDDGVLFATSNRHQDQPAEHDECHRRTAYQAIGNPGERQGFGRRGKGR